MANTGFIAAGSGANDASLGDVAWSNPTAILTDNGSRATSALAVGQSTQHLDSSSHGIAIPAGATIDGIVVRIQKQTGVASSTVKDVTVQLLKAGVATGDNKADTSTDWPNGDVDVDHGGAADLWGTTWTESDIEDSGFGVRVRAVNNHGSSSRTPKVDIVSIDVYYTEAGGAASPQHSLLGVGT